MTAIEWTDRTWNPTTGCSKVSPGCAHCYAETLSLRFGWSKKPWTPENAAENVVLHPERLSKPLSWRKPSMVFVNSMSDLFHELIPFDFVTEVFDVMVQAKQHTFQVLTKRPERMREFMRGYWHGGDPSVCVSPSRPAKNIWLGTSVENQRWADARVPILLDTPAAVRFLSCEPLLGPVTFRWRPWAPLVKANHLDSIRGGIHWMIVGGESGPTHRPLDAEWVRTLRKESVEAGTAFFFKQWGGRTPKSNGRILDGREWSEYPA
jgi:protein gp37